MHKVCISVLILQIRKIGLEGLGHKISGGLDLGLLTPSLVSPLQHRGRAQSPVPNRRVITVSKFPSSLLKMQSLDPQSATSISLLEMQNHGIQCRPIESEADSDPQLTSVYWHLNFEKWCSLALWIWKDSHLVGYCTASLCNSMLTTSSASSCHPCLCSSTLISLHFPGHDKRLQVFGQHQWTCSVFLELCVEEDSDVPSGLKR